MYEFDPRRIEKLDLLREMGVEPWPAARPVSHTAAEVLAVGAPLDTEALDALDDRFTVAGRVMAKNEMGKAGFAKIEDRSGRLQIYVRKNDLGEEPFALWKKIDLGDFVRVSGRMMRTRRGDLTLQCETFELASKCINSLPDKWKGLTDTEFRHRHRYVDLLMNGEIRDIYRMRARVIRYLRNFFDERDYIEVETPMLQVIPGGATARPFVTHHNALGIPMYLRVAPELYLKRLLVGGLERVYDLNRCFRNEGISLRHNPEFTMLEFYQAHATYLDLIELTEVMISGLAEEILGTTDVPYEDSTLDFSRPWRKATYEELLTEGTGLDSAALASTDAMRAFWLEKQRGADAEKLPESRGKWWDLLFETYVESTLRNPTFVTRFLSEVSPLSRRCDDDPDFVDRFELIVAGRELANAFTELNDPQDQAARFEAQVALRDEGDDEAMFFDSDYIHALCYAMPPAAGQGIGVDRLVMLLANQQSIREVILFPTLRPIREGGAATAEDDSSDSASEDQG
jgi:lysyl-tRNA synthetase class 2